MAFAHGVDVEKSIELIVLGTLVTGYFACGDLAEYIHGNYQFIQR
jgi:hypothetical protein